MSPASYTNDFDEQNPAAMFQSIDLIVKMRKESELEELERTRSSSTSSSNTERRPSIPERIIVTEDGVVRAIETIGVCEEERRGRKRLEEGAVRYYARFGERPVID
ncbi:hypothetical protein DPSP01_011023 [Paraphaeosphaeria sporulosa]